MPVTDHEIRRSLRRIAEGVPAEPAGTLRNIERRTVQAPSRPWPLGVVGAVAAVLVLIVVVMMLGLGHQRRSAPPSSPTPLPAGTPFRVIRTLEPRALGLRHVLRAAVSPLGYLVVTDRSQRVAEISATGRVLRSWGSEGTGPGQFRLQSGSLAVGSDGKIYVSDPGNARIQVFAPTGHFLTALGGYGTGPGHFITPRDLAVDRSGDVYVADDEASTLTKLSPTGRQLWRLSQADTTDPDLYGHFHFVGFDDSGHLVVANDDAGKVIWLNPDGTKARTFGSGASSFRSGGAARPVGEFPHGACGASSGPSGLLLVVSCQNPTAPQHSIEVFDSHHRVLAHATDAPYGTMPVFLPNGTAVLITARGAIVEARLVLPNQ
jgi:outer membrane protein assembly factor BamB